MSRPRGSAPGHGHAVLAAVTVALAFAAVVAGAVTLAGRGRDDFGGGSVRQLEDALAARSLTICGDTARTPTRDDDGAVRSREIAVGASGDCRGTLTLRVDTYGDVADRDAAARAAEARHRPRATRAVFTWQQFTVYLRSDDDTGGTAVRSAVISALDSVGAR
jgi:hypothetical protein